MMKKVNDEKEREPENVYRWLVKNTDSQSHLKLVTR